MKPRKIKYTPSFIKSLKKLPKSQIKALEKQEKMFSGNIFDKRLKTHKLKGELSNFYALSISYHWRLVFHIEDKDVMVLDAIGTHEVYK